MTDEMLRAEGIIGGPMAQLLSPTSYLDELLAACREAPSHVVGRSTEPFPARLNRLIDAPQEIDGALCTQVQALCDHYDVDEAVCSWLDDHRGETVFAVAW